MTWRRRPGEEGAIAVLISLLVVALIVPMAALVVDIGRQRVARRDMQALADMVSLDLAWHLDGRTRSDLVASAGWRSAARASVVRNLNLGAGETNALADPSRALVSIGPASEVLVRDGDLLVSAETGSQQPDGTFTPAAAGDVPTAVRVTAATSLPHIIAGGTGAANRTSVAAAEPSMCHRIGSWALDARVGDGALLGSVLKSIDADINLTAVSYRGLTDALVSLADVAAAVNAGQPEQFLNTPITLGRLLGVMVSALGDDTSSIDLLDASITRGLDASLKARTVRLGDLISVAGDQRAALASTVSVLDLVQGALLVANGTHALAVPGLALTVPNLTAIGVSATVIQRPQLACGPRSTARTSQVKIAIAGNLSVRLGLTLVTGRVAVEARLANAESTLVKATCGDGKPQSLTVQLSPPTLAGVDVLLDIRLLGLPVATARIPSDSTATNAAGPYDLPIPRSYDTPVSSPSGSVGVPRLTSAHLAVLGLPLGLLAAPLLIALNETVAGLEAALINQVLPLLGAKVAGADMYAVRFPRCAHPDLRG